MKTKILILTFVLAGAIFAQNSTGNYGDNSNQREVFFWDEAKNISGTESYFPVTLTDGSQSFVFFENVDKAKKTIRISFANSEKYQKWSSVKSLDDDFAYSGDEVPDMFSAAVSNKGVFAISVLDSSSKKGTVKVYSSADRTQSFNVYAFGQQEKQIVSSRIFSSASGGFVLFVSLGEGKQSLKDSSFSLLYSESADGVNWSQLSVFKPSDSISNAFSPYLTQVNGKDMVFFEGWYGKDPSSSQIYCSSKGPLAWSAPKLVTGENTVADASGKTFEDYKNYRPNVLSDGYNTKIAWERTEKTSATATVMVAPLNGEGTVTDKNDVEALNQYGNGRRPRLFKYHGKFFLTCFDDRNGANNVYMYENLGVQWIECDSITRLQNKKVPNSFGCPVISRDENGREKLSIIWQQQKNNENRIVLLEEDLFVEKPAFTARNFVPGKRGNAREVSVRVNIPYDISEIQGFCGIATFDKDEVPPKDPLSEFYRRPQDNLISIKIDEKNEGDRTVYFKACVQDKAGNWSETAQIEYYYDVTPPPAPVNVFYDKDSFGFASANDVKFSWEMDSWDDPVQGYSWNLEQITKLDKKYFVSKTKKIAMTEDECHKELQSIINDNIEKALNASLPDSRVNGVPPEASYRNRSNGLYLFNVRAIDSVGNVSEPASVFVFMNKFKAATQIRNVNTVIDEMGAVSITISGDEFEYDGTVSQVVITNRNSLSRYEFNKDEGDFEILKSPGSEDKYYISGIKIEDMKPGQYQVQIRHSERGVSTWNKNVVISENGTVKYERQYNFEPVWRISNLSRYRYNVDSERILFWCIMILILMGITGCARGLVTTVQQTMKIRQEVQAILKGDIMAVQTKERLEEAVKVKFSLKLKLGLFTTILLLFIVAGVALSIGSQMSNTQERILITGLKDRVKVVMGNMSSGVQTYLPDGREKLTELGSIVNQTDNFAEASYATIVSYHIDGTPEADGSMPLNYVWASNDSDILSKIEGSAFDAGTVKLKRNETFDSINVKVEKTARETVEEILSRKGGDEEVFAKLNELSAELSDSIPHLNDNKLSRAQTEYIFFWPVLYRQGRETRYLHSVVLLKVNTETLIEQVDASRRVTFFIAAAAAAVASVIGLICAIMLAAVIVNPIKRVVAHVKKITDTKDKEELEGFTLKIKTHDELRTLGDSVNEMTVGLVKGAKDEKLAKLESERAAKAREAAAKASEVAAKAQAQEAKARAEAAEMNIMNLDGQAVQKAFIPLVSEGAEKQTTAEMTDKDIQMYGYYEGTDAVSGDYFDYKKLDDRWYAIIKCDASGHGVPAALIMTIVATIFRRYFSTWSFKANGTKLNLLASDINDFIESLGFRGKFAAMLICLFDTKTGDVFMCNAGDNIVHYFDSKDSKLKILTLNESPAAGPLPSFMVEMKGGYKVEKFKLKPNDILFLYTDGIEESTRFFRDSSYEITECHEKGLKEGDNHENHRVGQTSEQMEPQRVKDVIEAVLNRKKYVLTKYHNPVAGEVLEFDFSKCEGTIQEAITALTAVEKIFRIYKKPGASGTVTKSELIVEGKSKTLIQINGDGIKVDRKIDLFLKKCFNRYDYYCSQKVDMEEPNYVYYTGVNEDSQADDLTLLAVRKM